MLIGEVARRSGVPPKTLRYYEDRGLLRPARTRSGYREFDDRVFDRLAFIRSAQALGLSLAEIGDIVTLRDNGEPPCAHVADLLADRAASIARTIGELRTLHAELTALIERAETFDPGECAPSDVCTLIRPRPGGASGPG